MKVNNLCDSCVTPRCIFQSGIIRTKCAFYMPPNNFKGVYTELPSKCKPGDVATLMICLRGGRTIYRSYICYEENIWSLINNEIKDGKLKDVEESEGSDENSD